MTKSCKLDKSLVEISSLPRVKCKHVVASVIVFVRIPPMSHSHQSGALTFHILLPRLVPIHLSLPPVVHLAKKNLKHEHVDEWQHTRINER